jgi:hypothetical protein
MIPLVVATFLPPDGTGADALLLLRRLLRRAQQEQPALPEAVAPPHPIRHANILPDCAPDRLAAALGTATLRQTLLSVGTFATPGADVAALAERGLLLAQLPFRDPVAAVRGVLGRGARGRPGRGLRGVATVEEAIALVAAGAPLAEAWLEVPEVLPIDLDRLAAEPGQVLPLVMAHLGLVPEREDEAAALLVEWTRRETLTQEADREAAALTGEQEAGIRDRLGPLHARCRAAAEAAPGWLFPD